jgi:tetratricopeptide (TPR) repeat protein
VFQLHTPTRWELETELAYAWSGVGSFVSALEIFKRLQLWPEVALCYHSVGQEDKARQVVRRQLFLSAEHGVGLDHYGTDAAEVATEKWDGPERSPPPPHAPRLWCILGDLDRDPACWSHAWEISKKRYARAQRSLGEYYSQKGEFDKAREAYMLATYVNRQNHESWARLGDVDLRQGNWDGAIVAYQQCLSLGEEGDAKSWSNLGSALVSKAEEIIRGKKVKTAVEAADEPDAADEEEDVDVDVVRASGVVEEEDPRNLIMQSLRAYKKAAQLAFSNWQIWDNVLTLAATRLSSPNWPDVLLAVRHILRIRAPSIGEAALDVDILGALVREVISMDRDEKEDAEGEHGVYVPPRGSLASATIRFFDEEVAPLITHRAVLYTLLEQLRLYTRDFAGALDCAEKGWRVSMSDSSSVNKGADGEGESGWLVNEERWREVVRCTEGLCDAFENYGGRIDGDGGDEKKWRLKARSAVRSVLGKAKEEWGHTVEYESLKGRLEELKG